MLYIHIPYCARKCIYCDFFSGGARVADWPRLRNALLAELQQRRDELPASIDSIYFGGGTPSLMPPQEFSLLMEGIRELAAGAINPDYCEITVESNPDDVDMPHVEAWKRAGVNRVSLGIQTLHDDLLRRIGRSHDSGQALRALEILSENFSNICADLIFGLPGGDEEQIGEDLRRLLSFPLSHISIYTLMYEEGTALTRLLEEGRIGQADEESVNAQYRLITATLRDAGFRHYEISNYARAGFESRHNSGYWSGKAYLGIGPSAHSYDGASLRRANPADLHRYLTHDFSASPFYTQERLTREQLMEERLMLQMRCLPGLDIADFGRRFGQRHAAAILSAARPHIAARELDYDGRHLTLTDAGLMIADSIVLDLAMVW